MENKDLDFAQPQEPQYGLDNPTCQKIMDGEKDFVAQALKVLENAKNNLISEQDSERPFKSNMLVALAFFEMSCRGEKNVKTVEEALLWAYHLDSRNAELYNILEQMGCNNILDKNELQQWVAAWAHGQEEEEAFGRYLQTVVDSDQPAPLFPSELEPKTEEERKALIQKFLEDLRKELDVETS